MLAALAALAALIEERLDVPADGVAITQAIALRDRFEARIAAAVGAFDAARLWDLDAATSMTAWLRANAKMTSRAAKRLTSVAARLHRLPVCSAAYAGGLLTSGQVEVIVACLDDTLAELFAGYEAELVPYLAPLTPAGISRAMASWKSRVQPDGPEPKEPERSLHLSQTLDNRWVLDGSFDAEGGSVIAAALRLASTDGTDVARTPSGRRADAMVDICRFFLDNQRTRSGGRHRPHLNVVAELDAVEEERGGRVVGGPALDGSTVSRLLCDCSLHRVITAGRSAILDYGTATRTIPAPLWSALVIRDEHCRFPGCDRPSNWCEGHHVVWVTHHGPTELANLVLLCSRHHHRLHQPGWHAKLRPDGGFEVTDPEGGVRTTSPPRASPGW